MINVIYTIMAVSEVKTDIITVSKIERDVILVIMPIKTFNTDNVIYMFDVTQTNNFQN
jgi:hypothetical protein